MYWEEKKAIGLQGKNGHQATRQRRRLGCKAERASSLQSTKGKWLIIDAKCLLSHRGWTYGVMTAREPSDFNQSDAQIRLVTDN